MRGLFFVALAAGCGFQANNGGQQQPVDAAGSIDAPIVTGDGPLPDAAADAMIDAPTGPQCPAGYDAIVGLSTTSRYRFVATDATWIDAENDCEDDAAPTDRATHLIVLDDMAEQTAMLGGLLGGTLINDQYIGLTDLRDEDESFAYVTNQQTTLGISPGSDSNTKDCVRIKSTGVAEARSCGETNRYVCECDGIPASPSRYPNPPDGNGND